MKMTALFAAVCCCVLLAGCGAGQADDEKTEDTANNRITYIPDSETVCKNLTGHGYQLVPVSDTTNGGNELISAMRGEEPPDFAAFMMIRAETADDLSNDLDAIDKADETLAQYSDARSYMYLDDEKVGNVYIYCTEGALKDAGIRCGD